MAPRLGHVVGQAVRMEREGKGWCIEVFVLRCIAYADDMLLMAASPADLVAMRYDIKEACLK
eukprot:12232312-Prorocentrum_lima.AAC.1